MENNKRIMSHCSPTNGNRKWRVRNGDLFNQEVLLHPLRKFEGEYPY